MANTYYDSELTAEEIEAVLEAINGILTPANNGKVLAISNGKFEARSVQWGGGSAVLEPLSVTQNGDYYPESGVDGFNEVHVDVSGGGEILPAIVTASSVYTAGYEGDKAFGSEPTNWWGSNSAQPGYLTIDFLEPVKITRVRFHNVYVLGSYHWADSRVVFQYSDDGSAWVDLFDKQNLPDSMDNENVESIQNPDEHRYYRFICYAYNTFYTGLGRVQFSITGGGGDDWQSLKNYIESSGTQYIDTGYNIKSNSIFECIANVNVQNSQFATVYGVRKSNMTNSVILFGNYSSDYRPYYNWGGNNNQDTALATNFDFRGGKTKYYLSKGQVIVQASTGQIASAPFSTLTEVDDLSLFIMCLSQGGTPNSVTFCKEKLYRFRIYEGGTLVHEFIPWQENGVACLKDTVTGNIKYNAGTGDFVYGTDS